jgi:anti-sigma28 factor (negative regulator of flagellin synthesis)
VHLELQPSSSGTRNGVHSTHQITEENEVVNLGTSQQLTRNPDEHLAPTGQALQADPQHNVRKTGQSISEIGDSPLSAVPLVEGMDKPNDSADAVSGSVLPLDSAPPISTPSSHHHKRKTKARTPVVEHKVRRSARIRRNADAVHIQLENEPRKRRGTARKTVRYSEVEELKAAIINRKIEHHDAEDCEIEDINATLLVELGTGFCGVPPMELNTSTLQDACED